MIAMSGGDVFFGGGGDGELAFHAFSRTLPSYCSALMRVMPSRFKLLLEEVDFSGRDALGDPGSVIPNAWGCRHDHGLPFFGTVAGILAALHGHNHRLGLG